MPKRRIVTVDNFIGARIRECRTLLGLTQDELGERLGVASQQLHKYERGINSVSAGRLYEIARELNTPIEHFYDGVGQNAPHPARLHHRMQLEMARLLDEIHDEQHLVVLSLATRVLAAPERLPRLAPLKAALAKLDPRPSTKPRVALPRLPTGAMVGSRRKARR
jgi:transcriptional regulator with XRE-family HTH domain